MQHQSAITITNDLSLRDMRCAGDLPYDAVLDLRFAGPDARPVDEEVLLRLRNLQIDYEQLPVDMHEPDSRRKNDLVRRITAGRDTIMILTEQPDALRIFCYNIDVTDTPYTQTETPATAAFKHSEAA